MALGESAARFNRRTFLGVAGMGTGLAVTGGIPAMVAAQKAPSFPKGTKLRVVAHFDNSTNNKFNPDPTKDVRWGDQTWEEMMIGFYGTIADLEPTLRTKN